MESTAGDDAVKLESVKQQNALELERLRQEFQRKENALKEKFERDKAAYDQNAQHIRALNQFLWQVPTIAITLTGGLWYGVTKIDNHVVQTCLLSFGAIGDILFCLVVVRVRFLFSQYLEIQKIFNLDFNIKSERGPWNLPSWTVVSCFVIMLFLAGVGSGLAAWKIDRISTGDPIRTSI